MPAVWIEGFDDIRPALRPTLTPAGATVAIWLDTARSCRLTRNRQGWKEAMVRARCAREFANDTGVP